MSEVLWKVVKKKTVKGFLKMKNFLSASTVMFLVTSPVLKSIVLLNPKPFPNLCDNFEHFQMCPYMLDIFFTCHRLDE